MRVLLPVHGSVGQNRAGTELYALGLAQALASRGLDVSLVYPEQPAVHPAGTASAEAAGAVRAVRLSLGPAPADVVGQAFSEPAGRAFGALLDRLAPDVVHFQHLLHFTAASAVECAQRGIPSLLTLHDPWVLCEQVHLVRPDGSFCRGGPESPARCAACLLERAGRQVPEEARARIAGLLARRHEILKETVRLFDAVLSPTRHMCRMLEQAGWSPQRLLVSPLGLRPVARTGRPAPGGPLRLGYLGNIHPTKGFDVLVRAMASLPPGKAELHAFGRIQVPSQVQGVEAGQGIRWHGAYAPGDLPGILSSVDAVVVPSRSENYPTVVREALSAGVPVLASRVGGIPEIVRDGENGLLFEPGDAADLARAVARCLDEPGLVARLAACPTALRGLEEEAEALAELYRAALSRRPASAAAAG
jgi:glycosyltransferase involved in cell wall biosynthesis